MLEASGKGGYRVNSSLIYKEMVIASDLHRLGSLIESKSNEIDLNLKELQMLAEKLNITKRSET